MYSTIPQLLFEKAKELPNAPAQFYKTQSRTFLPVTYMELLQNSLYFAAGLLENGTLPKENVALISDNRKEWLTASIGIMALSCADIPRGSEATVKDLSYILSFADCKTAVLENSVAFKKIEECLPELPLLKTVIMLDNSKQESAAFSEKGIQILSYDEIIEKGKIYRSDRPGVVESLLMDGTENDTATIIFTSGTTGTPKGVELTHKNFLCQTKEIGFRLRLKAGDKALSVLPVWHVYEREIEYYLLYTGAAICYSKPVLSMILDDFQKISPEFMACVPRVWDGLAKQIQKRIVHGSKRHTCFYALTVKTSKWLYLLENILHSRTLRFKKTSFIKKAFSKLLYIPVFFLLPFRLLGEHFYFRKIRSFFGGHFKLGMSGGGGLALQVDHFYNSIGIKLLEGYGLTETAPICCMRNKKSIVPGTIGKIMTTYCQAKVFRLSDINSGADISSLTECAPGEKGVLFIKGENVMKGYYKQPELTEQFVREGWFNTGDIVIRTINDEIIVKGRSKDTIVLRSGENVEPFPIECKLQESEYIAQAVVLGQDKNALGALIIPSRDALLEWAKQNGALEKAETKTGMAGGTGLSAKDDSSTSTANSSISRDSNSLSKDGRLAVKIAEAGRFAEAAKNYIASNIPGKKKEDEYELLLASEKTRTLFFSEIERLVTVKNGFKPYEKIGHIALLEKPFEVGVELSAKQDLVRWKIREIYRTQIEEMFEE